VAMATRQKGHLGKWSPTFANLFGSVEYSYKRVKIYFVKMTFPSPRQRVLVRSGRFRNE